MYNCTHRDNILFSFLLLLKFGYKNEFEMKSKKLNYNQNNIRLQNTVVERWVFDKRLYVHNHLVRH